MKLTQLLERLEYEVVQGDDQIEVTELINDSRKQKEGCSYASAERFPTDMLMYSRLRKKEQRL